MRLLSDDMSCTPPSAPDLAELEIAVQAALAARDHASLSIVGFGEVSVALGWPLQAPSWVCKRTPPMNRLQFDQYRGLVFDYVDRLRAGGVDVIDTTIHTIERRNDVVAYLVQPMRPADQIGHRVLAAATPDPEHPFLSAIIAALGVVDDRISIDAQVTNFAWDGETATLLDVGTPFMWAGDGSQLFDLTPFEAMLPAPARPSMRKELVELIARWKDPRAVGVDIVANLMREGLDEWVEPMIMALNRSIATGQPIERADAEAVWADDRKTFPLITRLKKVQRTWMTTVRRRPYEFFVNSTYGGSSLA